MTSAAYCPHCLQPVADDVDARFPPTPMRCPHCHLTIAPGRARADVDGTPGASGSAAGLLASAARREAAAPVCADAIDDALRLAARLVGTPVQRLRMIDYQRVSAANPALPALASILEQRGSWKGARRLVAVEDDAGEAGAGEAGAGAVAEIG